MSAFLGSRVEEEKTAAGTGLELLGARRLGVSFRSRQVFNNDSVLGHIGSFLDPKSQQSFININKASASRFGRTPTPGNQIVLKKNLLADMTEIISFSDLERLDQYDASSCGKFFSTVFWAVRVSLIVCAGIALGCYSTDSDSTSLRLFLGLSAALVMFCVLPPCFALMTVKKTKLSDVFFEEKIQRISVIFDRALGPESNIRDIRRVEKKFQAETEMRLARQGGSELDSLLVVS